MVSDSDAGSRHGLGVHRASETPGERGKEECGGREEASVGEMEEASPSVTETVERTESDGGGAGRNGGAVEAAMPSGPHQDELSDARVFEHFISLCSTIFSPLKKWYLLITKFHSTEI